ncbi:hypothetical protein Ancab_031144 [Ancistrocladus abbreviatus]
MLRPFGVKGHKRQKEEEKCDREELEQSVEEEATEQLNKGDTTAMVTLTQNEEEKLSEDEGKDLPGIPIAPLDQTNKPGVIFILEKASLEFAKVGKAYQILNSEYHANFLWKINKNPADYRPDIIHQVGAMARGKIDREFTDDYISISGYPLSAAWCIADICKGLARKWKIV